MKLIYFEFNYQKYHHPPEVEKMSFLDEKWVAANHLSVIIKNDSFYVTASKDWVRRNIPSLLGEYRIFCCLPEEEGLCYGTNNVKFLNYDEGVKRE